MAESKLMIACPCGSRAAVRETRRGGGFCAFCLGCGKIFFWRNPQLNARVEYGGELCPHHPEPKLCKDGQTMTSWCPICRVRVFIPGGKK